MSWGMPLLDGAPSKLRTTPRVAVVGLGYWGPNLLRVLIESNEVKVRWMCDRDPERLERFGRRYPAVAKTAELDEVLADPGVDAVLLATPVHTHHALAMRCLEAGKHVFVEKPLASSTEEAAALVEFADQESLLLMCGHTFLYSPPVRLVKQLLDSGELGDLYFISSSRVNLGLHQRDVSVVWDLGPHDFSILLYWLGSPPSAIRATGRDSIVPGIADVAFVSLEFDSNLIVNVELSWLAPSKLRRTVLVGSKKMVVYEDGGPEPIKIFDRGVDFKDPETFGEYQLSYRTGDVLTPNLPNGEPLSMQLVDFVGAIRDRCRPTHDLELAQNVVRMAEAAEQSLAEGGRRISLQEGEIFARSIA